MRSTVLNVTWPAKAAVVAAIVVGCVAPVAFHELAYVAHKGVVPVLSMGRHVVEWECTCEGCHPGVRVAGKDAGMPDRASCLECHEGLNDAPNFILDGLYFDAEDKPKWTVSAVLTEGVVFGHAEHTDVFDCYECHGDILGDDYAHTDIAVRFESCERCHQHEEASGTCRYCHKTHDTSTRPHSHDARWMIGHGTAVTYGCSGLTERVCMSCHDASSCQRCHSEMRPSDHTQFFERAGHGMAAGVEPSRCYACHAKDTCVGCHMDDTPPMPPDADHYPLVLNSCAGPAPCHWQNGPGGHTLLTENCLLCHK